MKQMIFSMGLPGAGKSTVSHNKYPNATVIDPDAIKAAHPDYDASNPQPLHVWSKGVAEKMFANALGDQTENVQYVIDGTGTDAETLVKKIRQAENNGFRTTLLFVMVSLPVAIKRNAARARKVPESIIRQKAEVIYQAFEVVSQEVREVVVVNNF